MSLETLIGQIRQDARESRPQDPFLLIEDELGAGLLRYWETAGRILRDSGVRLLPPPPAYRHLSRNFFSLLFLYSYHRAALPPARRVLYAAINQCLRGMVTGCDNLLDDEYKKTLETDLPETGTKIRSVLDIMVSDRVLFDLLMDCRRNTAISDAQVSAACSATLRALTRSAVQEASEEGGVRGKLHPQEVLSRVHHYKTGLLFQCVWAVPDVLDPLPLEETLPLKSALYNIGMGCQVLDDMVDLASDVRGARHNYAAALIYHTEGEAAWRRLETHARSNSGGKGRTNLILHFPDAVHRAANTAEDFLFRGLSALFLPAHHVLVQPAISFIARQIGAEDLIVPDSVDTHHASDVLA